MAKKKFNTIKEARESKNLTQKNVAEASNISESYYSLIENSKRRVPMPLASTISKSIGLTLDEFFLLCNFTKCQENTINLT